MLKVALRQQLHLKTFSKHKELTKSGKELTCNITCKIFKRKIIRTWNKSFTLSYPINLSSGKKLRKMFTITIAKLKCREKKN